MRTTMPLMLLLSLALSAPAAAWAQTPGGERQRQEAFDRQRERMEALHRELERAIHQFNVQRAALTPDATAAQRESLVAAQRNLELARTRLNQQLEMLLSGDMAPARLERPRVLYRYELGADSLRFFQPSQPSGWLGINFSARWLAENDAAGKPVWRFAEYPVIEAVEPGSPAERAGLVAGDVLVSIGGRDLVRGSTPFTELLRPGASVPLEVRRGTQLRRMTAQVIARPATSFTVVVPARTQGVTDAATAVVLGEGRAATSVRGGVPGDVATIRLVPAPVRGASPLVAVAGAELLAFRGDFQEAFGAREGILVMRVGPGTPADRAGLRSGDVILTANGAPTRTPDALRAVLERDASRNVLVELLRGKEPKQVRLRW